MEKPYMVSTKVVTTRTPAGMKRSDEDVQSVLRDCASKIEQIAERSVVSGMNCSFNIYDDYIIEVSATIWPKKEVADAIKLQEKRRRAKARSVDKNVQNVKNV